MQSTLIGDSVRFPHGSDGVAGGSTAIIPAAALVAAEVFPWGENSAMARAMEVRPLHTWTAGQCDYARTFHMSHRTFTGQSASAACASRTYAMSRHAISEMFRTGFAHVVNLPSARSITFRSALVVWSER